VFDFARFNYDDVAAEDGHVVAVFNIGLTGTDAIIKIVDHWTVRDGKALSLWAAYFEPQRHSGSSTPRSLIITYVAGEDDQHTTHINWRNKQ
jgi:hypothetical protein